MASAESARPKERIHRALQPGKPRATGADMLKKTQLASRPDDPEQRVVSAKRREKEKMWSGLGDRSHLT